MASTPQYQRIKYHRQRIQRRTRFQAPLDPNVYSEYLQVQQELAAFLNVPVGFRLGVQFWRTVRHLERRLDDLELQLLQPTA